MIVSQIQNCNCNQFKQNSSKSKNLYPQKNYGLSFRGNEPPEDKRKKLLEIFSSKVTDAANTARNIAQRPWSRSYDSNNALLNEGRALDKIIEANNKHLSFLDNLFQETLQLRQVFGPQTQYDSATNDKDTIILKHFMDAMANLGENKGFKRIGGYEKEKELLTLEFGIKKIGLSRTSFADVIEVPNALLFYGPTGVGKTTFALGLAEQTLSFAELMNPPEGATDDEIMKEILKKADKSKSNFKESGADKKRTIIILDEANSLVNSAAFNDFVKSCSNDYNCTLFLTANYPKRIKPETLKLMSRIECIEPPDRNNTKAVINHVLKLMKKSPLEYLEPALDRLAPSARGLYSNTDISMIVKNVTRGKDSITASDIKNYIDNEDFKPSIKPIQIDKFIEQKKFISELLKGIKL